MQKQIKKPMLKILNKILVAIKKHSHISIIPHKIWLSLEEAEMLSGIPKEMLNQARLMGQLETAKIGGEHKVYRGTLEESVKLMFGRNQDKK